MHVSKNSMWRRMCKIFRELNKTLIVFFLYNKLVNNIIWYNLSAKRTTGPRNSTLHPAIVPGSRSTPWRQRSARCMWSVRIRGPGPWWSLKQAWAPTDERVEEPRKKQPRASDVSWARLAVLCLSGPGSGFYGQDMGARWCTQTQQHVPLALVCLHSQQKLETSRR